MVEGAGRSILYCQGGSGEEKESDADDNAY